MVLSIFLLILGFALLVKCSDFFVDGASGIARKFKIPATVVGLTIVSFGTSAPEVATAFTSVGAGVSDLMVGNALASYVVNIGMVLGIAIMVKPFKVSKDEIFKQIPMLFLFASIFCALVLKPLIDGVEAVMYRWEGLLFVLLFMIFVYYLICVIVGNKNSDSGDNSTVPEKNTALLLALLVGGLAGVIIGANFVVDSAQKIAQAFGWSEKLISVTILCIGTSLPELMASIVAAKKGEAEIALGNIIGSNIFNTSVALGLPVLMLGKIPMDAFGLVDAAFVLGSVILIFWFCFTKRSVSRIEGAALFAVFVAYEAYCIMMG